MRLAAARWPQVEAARRRVLVVPVGSLEQHGPHLPLDTDTRIAAEVARRACARVDGAWLAPALPIGASGEHAGFPGTLSIGTEALALTLVELGRHVSADWPTLVLANGHGGNAEALASAAELLRAEGRDCRVWHAAVRGADPHAGRTETSLMLAIDPAAVDLAAARPGDTRPIADLLPLLREGGVRPVSPSGVLGDPAGASAAEGERLLTALTASLATRLVS